jgi:uncharacterized protein GlcG (DUF336 family)
MDENMLEESRAIAASAEQAAVETGVKIVVSVVDIHGNPVLVHRMDGAPLHAIDMAHKKAFTAATLNVETQSLAEKVLPGQALYNLTMSSGGYLVSFGGGGPVELPEGNLLGVGISGGTTEQDEIVLALTMDRWRGRTVPIHAPS